ncbi:hypothetical protein CVT24_006680 [Panaeolus cyanescens]|uniref:Uncharacterized protein n=1 Tax=Panaeolus cyanescens TaxID=181874 RepID=A0A409YRT7_9AGAR|nr:hypothetical protein CVT24_006680 [Panaeolus cyanescens]
MSRRQPAGYVATPNIYLPINGAAHAAGSGSKEPRNRMPNTIRPSDSEPDIDNCGPLAQTTNAPTCIAQNCCRQTSSMPSCSLCPSYHYNHYPKQHRAERAPSRTPPNTIPTTGRCCCIDCVDTEKQYLAHLAYHEREFLMKVNVQSGHRHPMGVLPASKQHHHQLDTDRRYQPYPGSNSQSSPYGNRGRPRSHGIDAGAQTRVAYSHPPYNNTSFHEIGPHNTPALARRRSLQVNKSQSGVTSASVVSPTATTPSPRPVSYTSPIPMKASVQPRGHYSPSAVPSPVPANSVKSQIPHHSNMDPGRFLRYRLGVVPDLVNPRTHS